WPRSFFQRPWCLLKNAAEVFSSKAVVPSQKYGRPLPFTKVVGHILAKVARHILTKVAECFILKKLGRALLEYLGRPLLLQKAGLGRIFSLLTLAPSSQHLGKQSPAKGVEVRWEVKAQATDSRPRFPEINVHVMEASQGNKSRRLMIVQHIPKHERIKQSKYFHQCDPTNSRGFKRKEF
ncbi:unnamed protein product, partial [Prunus brigantina]